MFFFLAVMGYFGVSSQYLDSVWDLLVSVVGDGVCLFFCTLSFVSALFSFSFSLSLSFFSFFFWSTLKRDDDDNNNKKGRIQHTP